MSKCNKNCYYKIFGLSDRRVTPEQVQAAHAIRINLVNGAIRGATTQEEQDQLASVVTCLDAANYVLGCDSTRRIYNREHTSFQHNHDCAAFEAATTQLKELKYQANIRELKEECRLKSEEIIALTDEVQRQAQENAQLKRMIADKDRIIDELRMELGRSRATPEPAAGLTPLLEAGADLDTLAQPSDSFMAYMEGLDRDSAPAQSPQVPMQSGPVSPANMSPVQLGSPIRQSSPLGPSSPVRQSSPRRPGRRQRRRFVPSRDQTTCIITGIKFRSQGPMMTVKFSEDGESREIHAEDIVEAFPEECRDFMRRLQAKGSSQLRTMREKHLSFLLNLL